VLHRGMGEQRELTEAVYSRNPDLWFDPQEVNLHIQAQEALVFKAESTNDYQFYF